MPSTFTTLYDVLGTTPLLPRHAWDKTSATAARHAAPAGGSQRSLGPGVWGLRCFPVPARRGFGVGTGAWAGASWAAG